MLDAAILAALRAQGPTGVPCICAVPEVRQATPRHVRLDSAVEFRLAVLVATGVVRRDPLRGWYAV